MKNLILFILLLTSVTLGATLHENSEKLAKLRIQLVSTEEQLAAANADTTTDEERRAYGPGCVSWLTEQAKKEGSTDAKPYLGRSWKKHGQLVFEIFGNPDAKPPLFMESLCVYDVQSGMMFRHTGAQRDMWMFY